MALVGAAVGLVTWLRPRPVSTLTGAQADVASGPELQRVVRILLQSNPPGARVFDARGRMVASETPKEVVVPLHSYQRFDFFKDGHHAATHGLRADSDTTVAVVLPSISAAPPVAAAPISDAGTKKHRRVPASAAAVAAPRREIGQAPRP